MTFFTLLMHGNVSVCVGKRIQETICLGASIVLIAFNFCCLYVHFESCYTYSIIAAACECYLHVSLLSLNLAKFITHFDVLQNLQLIWQVQYMLWGMQFVYSGCLDLWGHKQVIFISLVMAGRHIY